MRQAKLLIWSCELLLTGSVCLGLASCSSECDGAVFSKYSSVTLEFDKPIVVDSELDITIVGDDGLDSYGQPIRRTSQTSWYVDRLSTSTGTSIWPVYDRESDGGVHLVVKSVVMQSAPKSLTYHLVADGVTVADGSATPAYQHLVESHESCSLPYDQSSVTITVQQ